jgi:hypothetical protein
MGKREEEGGASAAGETRRWGFPESGADAQSNDRALPRAVSSRSGRGRLRLRGLPQRTGARIGIHPHGFLKPHIFFIFAGAFEGLDDIVRRRTQTAEGIGFRQGQRGTSGPQMPRPSVAIEGLIEFGMVREFVGRLATIAEVQPLDVGALARILVEPRNSWLERTKRFFAAHGAELHLSRGAIRALAERAANHGTGARALDRVATAALESTVWRLLRSEQPVARVEVTRTTVERGVEARFRMGSCLRLKPRPGPPPKVHPTASEPAQAEPVHCTAAEYRAAIDLLEGELCLDQAAKPAQAWWRSIRAAHDQEPRELHDLALQLRERRTTIHELFLASASARTEDLRTVLHYLDSKRLLDG